MIDAAGRLAVFQRRATWAHSGETDCPNSIVAWQSGGKRVTNEGLRIATVEERILHGEFGTDEVPAYPRSEEASRQTSR
ncbi:hypothetical protein [Paraburkholderia sp. BL25I1N1]|uniref:hypothetical protein n=1 Tax=Paraburkholderia sp. BL25I1N1 TaxID=1938804 RepID=UPI000D073CDE|nr:hypothetical protein [Paraburkholderia sp. BL25I1N1]PRY06180.1 hypothetical protein B0G73_10778 [Paraburkholderia sp. BL25I1N1]